MTAGDGRPVTREELEEVSRRLSELTERVARLEPPTTRAPRPEMDAPLRPAAKPESVAEPRTPVPPRPTVVPTAVHGEPTEPARGPRTAGRAGWRIGPLAKVPEESLPVVAMSAAGGLALLMGLLYFAWYSIQQGWISPRIRLATTALFGLGALGQAWRLGGRNSNRVAAALGGAGLGAWFGAILFARHAHDLLGPTSTFVMLAGGAGLGLAVAAHRNLRLLALLAALGAFLTPLAVGSGADRLNEVMAYQLVVVLFLFVLESRRRWPELGHFGLASSWLLLFAWASAHLAGPNRPFLLAWTFAFLILGHVQAWNLRRRGSLPAVHAVPRLWLNAIVAWIAGFAAVEEQHGYLTLWMALWNGATAALLVRAGGAAGRVLTGRLATAACVSVGWLQLLAFAPLRWSDDRVLLWWTAMATLPAVLHLRRPRPVHLAPLIAPYVAAVGWSLSTEGRVETGCGFYLAALPLAMALVPGRGHAATRAWRAVYVVLLLATGLFVWNAMAWHHVNLDPREGWVSALGVVALALGSARVGAARMGLRALALLVVSLGFVAQCLVIAAAKGLLRPSRSLGEEHVWQLGALLGISALSWSCAKRFRPTPREPWSGRAHDLAGAVLAAGLLVVAMLLVSGSVQWVTESPGSARSLHQAGWSVAGALTGLGLLLRGLFATRSAWRRLGILLLFATAAKLLLVDLVSVSMAWRVLSFVALGSCLLLGAHAYRRLGSWVEESSPGDPASPIADGREPDPPGG